MFDHYVLHNEELSNHPNQIYRNNIKYLLINKLILIYININYIILHYPVYEYQPLYLQGGIWLMCDHSLLPDEELFDHSNQIYRNNIKYLLIYETLRYYDN